MGFYYFSLFSWMVFAAYFAIGAAIIIRVCKANNLNKRWMVMLLTVAFIAPWTEELWIAYNFGQLCRKDAGKFIYKTVEVDGYYDDRGVTRLPPDSPYRFIESPDGKGKFHRVDRASPQEEDGARKWYEGEYKGDRLEKGKNEWIRYRVNDRIEVIVEIDSEYSWRITRLDKPTARYHYSMNRYGIPVAHKINRQEYRVEDSVANEVLGKYVSYSRKAYWFFIGLDAPSLSCNDLKPKAQRTTYGILNDVIQPKK